MVISTSLRNNSNTDILSDEFIRGAVSSGQMQTLLDRTYPLFPWKLNLEQTHRFRNVYLLTASSGESEEFSDKVITKIEDWIKHFSGVWVKCPESAKLACVIRGLGVHEPGEIRKHPYKMNEAYEMGKAV